MFLLKLAVLNIGRNPRRSVVTILAVSVGLAAVVFLQAFMDGSKEQQRDNAVRLYTGHVQIQAAGFDKKLAAELTVPDSVSILPRIQSQAHVVAVTERVKSEGLIGTSENSRGVLILGIDPEREAAVTDIHKYVDRGAYLSAGDDRSVMIGDKLAERIEAGRGDKGVVMTQAVDGTLAGYAYRVKGILHAGNTMLDEVCIFMTVQSARDLLGIEGLSHQFVVRLTGRDAIAAFLPAVKKFLPAGTYEVLTWDDIIPDINQWGKWADGIIGTVLVTVMVVIGVGVINTILMSIFERTKELGVMMAIGTSPDQIVVLIFLETLVLELAGIVIGLAAGYLVVFYFSKVGITFHGAEEAFARSFMSNVTYPQLRFYRVIHTVVTLLGITAVIGLYPAWRAGRMEPVKAIYHS